MPKKVLRLPQPIQLYMTLEGGKLEMDDLAPRIKELRAYQHELQQQRDDLIRSIEANEPEKLDENEVVGWMSEWGQLLSENSFLLQKTFLRRFVRRMELTPDKIIMDYTIPFPVGKNRTSTREVLCINQIGSGGWI